MTKLLPLILCAALASCTSTKNLDGTTTTSVDGQQVAAIATLAINAYTASRGAKNPTAAKADLSGIATLAQGFIGSTPAKAQLAQGAVTPAVGKAVQAALPQAPITQQTVNTLFAAAQ